MLLYLAGCLASWPVLQAACRTGKKSLADRVNAEATSDASQIKRYFFVGGSIIGVAGHLSRHAQGITRRHCFGLIYSVLGGNRTGADETAGGQSKLVHLATLFALVRPPPRTMFLVQ